MTLSPRTAFSRGLFVGGSVSLVAGLFFPQPWVFLWGLGSALLALLIGLK